ncbi:MAG TPA: hypothetical protein DCZ01_08385 [Elusimicrobia bacterium]|nr:hypothetical protein [Elusimicrobiota bacterium]
MVQGRARPLSRVIFLRSLIPGMLILLSFALLAGNIIFSAIQTSFGEHLHSSQKLFVDTISQDLLMGANAAVYGRCQLYKTTQPVESIELLDLNGHPLCGPWESSRREGVLIESPIYFDESGKEKASVLRVRYSTSLLGAAKLKYGLLLAMAIFVLGVIHFIVARVISANVSAPISDISRLLASGDVGAILRSDGPRTAIQEVGTLQESMKVLAARIVEYQKELVAGAQREAVAQLAAQVAHDIRSPLAALESLLNHLRVLPEEERMITRSSINRIRDIANNLLEKNRTDGKDSAAETAAQDAAPSVELLSSLIEPLVTEKRLSFRSKLGVEIDARLDASAYGLFARVQPREFKRLLSNLVNNSVEALGASGSVTLTLAAAAGESIIITVKDDGPGIPPKILAKLGKRGETHGKAGGSGLGLYHARTTVESWGGSLELQSVVGRGTTAVVRLPKARPPEWFISVLELDAQRPVVVLDDDTSIHQVWQGRFDSLRPTVQPLEVLHFSTPAELRDWVKADTALAQGAVYLMDYELLGHKDTGLALIAELGLGARAILVTSRFEEKAILEECLRLKARMIPKGLASFVPIRVQTPTGASEPGPVGKNMLLDAVLIDDDPLTRMNWKMAASRSDKKFKSFSTVVEFLNEAPAISLETPVYVDAKLADDVNGAQESLRIHELGFQEIYLATGHEAAKFAAYKHLRGVVGKEPPWG